MVGVRIARYVFLNGNFVTAHWAIPKCLASLRPGMASHRGTAGFSSPTKKVPFVFDVRLRPLRSQLPAVILETS